MTDAHIAQIALCAHNAGQLRHWYRSVFELAPGSGALVSVPPMPTRRIQGIDPNPAETVTWLVDQQDYFQLEFFQFYRPLSKLKPTAWRPCDIGYGIIGICVADFEATLYRYAAHSDAPPPPSVVGESGRRRACVRDPEGNWIEILERDPLDDIAGAAYGIVRPELGAVVRFMRVSVPDLKRARETYVDALGLVEVADGALHSDEDEALWGLPGASTDTLLLRGSNFLVELVQYLDPEPAPRPAGYQICDQGVMNIALGFRTPAQFDAAFARATGHGLRPNGKPVDIGIFRVMYVNNADGFSVEMLCARPSLWSLSGFSPGGAYVQNEVLIRAQPERVWQRLIDHAGLGDWTLFRGRVLRPGAPAEVGPGCMRELKAFGLRITEEVVSWEQGSHYRYRLRSGAPFRWHCGDVFVTAEQGECTRVRWAIRFESWLPFTGKLTAWVLGRIFRRALGQLKQQLEAS